MRSQAERVILFPFGVNHGAYGCYSVEPSEKAFPLLLRPCGRMPALGDRKALSRLLAGELDALLKVWVRESSRKEVLL
jgi:hypothetical protein